MGGVKLWSTTLFDLVHKGPLLDRMNSRWTRREGHEHMATRDPITVHRKFTRQWPQYLQLRMKGCIRNYICLLMICDNGTCSLHGVWNRHRCNGSWQCLDNPFKCGLCDTCCSESWPATRSACCWRHSMSCSCTCIWILCDFHRMRCGCDSSCGCGCDSCSFSELTSALVSVDASVRLLIEIACPSSLRWGVLKAVYVALTDDPVIFVATAGALGRPVGHIHHEILTTELVS